LEKEYSNDHVYGCMIMRIVASVATAGENDSVKSTPGICM
jgi:hypothetical protein